MYVVDGDEYHVTQGQCFVGRQPVVQGGRPDPSQYEDPQGDVGMAPVRTDTIDGTEVYVYEISVSGHQESITYYVETGTGYPRHIAHSTGTMSFHSWGAVDPVEKLEMGCQELPECS